MSDEQQVDLTNCDREPIHIPGSIQPHGALLAFDSRFAVVERHSANAATLLGMDGDINGQAAEDLLGIELTHALRNALPVGGDPARPVLLFGQTMPSGVRVDISLHQHLNAIIVEFEPTGAVHEQPLQLARLLIGEISRLDSIDEVIRQTARLVRGALGYDRVMVYQFEADGAGKVVSEVKRPDLESFLGQYFPASDIPQQARALYLKNTIRVISSANYRPVALVPVLDAKGAPLDLSHAHLRSVSPIHLEYLRNMGVGASMSVSIIVDGQLWGMIACHHYSDKVLSMSLRVAAEMFGEFLSLHLSSLRQKQKLETAQRARSYLDRVLTMASHGDISDLLKDNLADFGRLLPNDGYGLYLGGEWIAHGSTPDEAQVAELVTAINTLSEGRVWATHKLAATLPDAERYSEIASGVLVIPLSQLPRDYLLFFRREMVRTLNWAGNPEKSYTTGPMGDRLTPRKSFAIWKESVHQQAQPWTEADQEIAEAARAALVEVVLRHSEAMAEEQAKAEVRRRMLNEELNHRVKNILAVIKSVVGQPVSEGRGIEEFVETLQGRIQSLAFAHDQITRGDGGGTLSDLLNAELTPYRTERNAVVLAGPSVWMDARAFSVMALVLHEMATNAAKYGALSQDGGRLDITWQTTAEDDLAIVWQESGGPEVREPGRSGFGTALLSRTIPYDLGGESRIAYDAAGVRAQFRLPARHVRRMAGAAAPVQATVATAAAPANAEGGIDPDTRILLVEDQMLIALDVESMLEDEGFRAVTTCNSAESALRHIAQQLPQVAILDINLGHGTSIPVAQLLHERGVPFVFATGYGDSGMVPEDLQYAPVVKKPYEPGKLIAALRAVWGS